MLNKIIAFGALIASGFCFYYASVYQGENEPGAVKFMIGLGIFWAIAALLSILDL